MHDVTMLSSFHAFLLATARLFQIRTLLYTAVYEFCCGQRANKILVLLFG